MAGLILWLWFRVRSPTEHNVLFQTAYVVGPNTQVIWAPIMSKGRGRVAGG